MRYTRIAAFAAVVSLAVFGAFLVFAQGGNLFPTTEGSSTYQGGQSLTPAGESFTEFVEINPEAAVSWTLTGGGGGGSVTPIVFAPNTNFSVSGLTTGVSSYAGVAFEFQESTTTLALATAGASAQVGQQFTAGVSTLEVTMISEASGSAPAEFLGELVGGGPGGDGPTLFSFTFTVNSADLEALANGEEITVEANNNGDAAPLYQITEATITMAEDGLIFIAGLEFTE